ncbi:hypothetical protein J6590_047791 [Homalodisca vitripennis]|nr:hypothetical protein J6590_047791 [Homalodisca vitripennis]
MLVYAYPFLPTLSSRIEIIFVSAPPEGEVVACNRHGDRVGQCAGANRATFDRGSERAQSGRLSVNGFGRVRTCGGGVSGRVR